MGYQRNHPLFTLLLAALAVAGVGAQAAETKVITIENAMFSPAVLSVKSGDTVVWRNLDLFPHNATANKRGFASGEIAPNGSWKFVATRKGEFAYVCTLHPSMTGKLVVK